MHDGADACESVGKLVADSNHVAAEGVGGHGLIGFGSSAGGVEEPSDVFRVDAAGGVIVLCTIERIHAEAALGNHAVWVDHIVSVAEEALEVALVRV